MCEAVRCLCVVAVAFVAAGCAGFDPYNIVGRQPLPRVTSDVPVAPPDAGLDAATRRAAIDYVWTTINERYHDPKLNGVDWVAARAKHEAGIVNAKSDADFWELLDKMTGELKDSHTRVHSPQQLADQENFRSSSLGFIMREFAGEYYFSTVSTDSDAWWAGARVGMKVTRFDGKTPAFAFAESLANVRDTSTASAKRRRAMSKLLVGEAGSSVAISFERFDGTPVTATLKRRVGTSPPTMTSRELPSGYGYIRFSGWNGGLTNRLVAAIREHQKTPGLIIDLRDNGGGSAAMVATLAQQLVKGDVDSGKRMTRTGEPVTLAWGLIKPFDNSGKLKGVEGAYDRPVVVLVNDASASASELFAGSLQDLGRATVVGTQTCGCLLAYFGYARIPGGGGLAYSELSFRTAKGNAIEQKGVVPDVIVEPNLQDLREARDRVLETAIAWLETTARHAPRDRAAAPL